MKLELLNSQELEKLKELIKTSDDIIVCCHKSPDGDAMGSTLAWTEYLRQVEGKRVNLIVPDAFPDFLRWLPNIEKVLRYDKHKEQCDVLFQKADLVCCLDFGSSERVLDMECALLSAPGRKLMFDHHLSPTLSVDLLASFPSLSSTSELIFRIIYQLGRFDSMTKQMAIPIYCGMMTDTGGFTYNSSSPEIFEIIGMLLTKGIDKDKIYRNVFNNYSSWALRFRAYIIYQKLNVIEHARASYFAITKQEMKRFHFIKGDAEGLVNEPLKIKGMRLSISLREDDRKDNLVWVSLRSVGAFACNKIAEKYFNGGGHMNASGGRLNCSIDEAEKIVRQAIAESCSDGQPE